MAGEGLDPLAISSGMGTGEAQVVAAPSQPNWGQIFNNRLNHEYARRLREKQAEDKAKADLLKQFEKLPDKYWDKDAPDIHARSVAHQTSAIENNHKYGVDLPPDVLIQQQREIKQLENDAMLSYQQKAEHKKVFDEVNKNGSKYTPESLKAVTFYEDPTAFKKDAMVNNKGEETTVGEELKRVGGSVYRFRAENPHLLKLDEAYNIIDRTKEVAALIPENVTTTEQAGNLFGSNQKGSVTKKSTVPDEKQALLVAKEEFNKFGNKPIAEVNRVFFDGLKAEERDKFVHNAWEKAGLLKPDGEFSDAVLALPPAQRNELLKKTGYEYALADIFIHAKKTEYGTTFTPFAKEPKGDTAKTPDELWTKTPSTGTGGGGRETFNKKHGTNYTEEEWKGMNDLPEATKYIAIEPKSGKTDTESLELDVNGKQVRPMGYRIANGKVYIKAAESQRENTGGEDKDGIPITREVFKIRHNIELNDDNLANVASHYHFKNIEDFKKWLSEDDGSKKKKGDAKKYGL